MRWLDYFRSNNKPSASTAKERLQIIIAHERKERTRPVFMDQLQAEILEVVKKYVKVNADQVRLNLEKSGEFEVLELNITLPEALEAARPEVRA